MSEKEFSDTMQSLKNFAIAWRNVVAPDDLLQDTAERAWIHRDKFDGKNLRAWLIKILNNLGRNHAKKRKRYYESLESVQIAAPTRTAVSDSAKDLLLTLTRKQMSVCILKLHGYNDSEIATILNSNINSIKTHWLVARKKLKA